MINSTCVWVDSSAAIAVATGNDFTYETVKYAAVKVRFIQECVQRKIIMISYIRTSRNIADIMNQAVSWTSIHAYALGYLDAINSGFAADAAVLRRIRFRV